MLQRYFKGLYQRAAREAYSRAHAEIVAALQDGGSCLDCGAHDGHRYELLSRSMTLERSAYHGIEWNEASARAARDKRLNVVRGDLNHGVAFPDDTFRCVFALSVLEHLLNPCRYLRESYRCLEKGGALVLLTPNISTYFTVGLLLAGKMPSSGPHPDSDALLRREELFKVSDPSIRTDAESETPVHRHLVVFSYRVLKSYLQMLGFTAIRGYGFGLYPFPNFMQGLLERVDRYHCHQMVFVARK